MLCLRLSWKCPDSGTLLEINHHSGIGVTGIEERLGKYHKEQRKFFIKLTDLKLNTRFRRKYLT